MRELRIGWRTKWDEYGYDGQSDRKVIVVASPRFAHMVQFSDIRDHELRLAHQKAFTKMAEARSADDASDRVSRAIEELVEACEAYTLVR
jgi:inorganic pyrophosphatase